MSAMSSPSSRRRFHVRRRRPAAVVVDIGCGCQRKPKLFSLLNYFSRNSPATNTKKSSSSYNSTDTITTTITNSTFSPCNKDGTAPSSSSSASPCRLVKKPTRSKKNKKGAPLLQVAEESVAVEKDSSDPYVDFKESMVQMIVEKQMYQWEELRELLNLFLSLNSPYHHPLILRAFNEVWEGLLFSQPPYVHV